MKEIYIDTYGKNITDSFSDSKPCKGSGFQIASSVIPYGSYVVIDGSYKIFVEPLTVYDIPIERTLEYYFPPYFTQVNMAVTGSAKFSQYSDPIKIIVFDEKPTYIQKKNFLLTVEITNLNSADYFILNRLIGMQQIKATSIGGNTVKYSMYVQQGFAPVLCYTPVACFSHFSDYSSVSPGFNTVIFEHNSQYNCFYTYYSTSNAFCGFALEFCENSHIDSSNKLYFYDTVSAGQTKNYYMYVPYKTLGIAFVFKTDYTPVQFILYRYVLGLWISIKSSSTTSLDQNWYTLMDEQRIRLTFQANATNNSTLEGLVCFKSYR